MNQNVQELSSVVIDAMKNGLFEFYRERSMNRNECLIYFYQEYDSDFVSARIIRDCLFHTYIHS